MDLFVTVGSCLIHENWVQSVDCAIVVHQKDQSVHFCEVLASFVAPVQKRYVSFDGHRCQSDLVEDSVVGQPDFALPDHYNMAEALRNGRQGVLGRSMDHMSPVGYVHVELEVMVENMRHTNHVVQAYAEDQQEIVCVGHTNSDVEDHASTLQKGQNPARYSVKDFSPRLILDVDLFSGGLARKQMANILTAGFLRRYRDVWVEEAAHHIIQIHRWNPEVPLVD